MKDILMCVFVFVLVVALCLPWFINASKFLNCDFESNYKCEAIHGVGLLMPPASYITAWFPSDS